MAMPRRLIALGAGLALLASGYYAGSKPPENDKSDKKNLSVKFKLKLTPEIVSESMTKVRDIKEIAVSSYGIELDVKEGKIVQKTNWTTHYSHKDEMPKVDAKGLVFYHARNQGFRRDFLVFSKISLEDGTVIDGRTYDISRDNPGLLTGFFSPGDFFHNSTDAEQVRMKMNPVVMRCEFYQRTDEGKVNIYDYKFSVDYTHMTPPKAEVDLEKIVK